MDVLVTSIYNLSLLFTIYMKFSSFSFQMTTTISIYEHIQQEINLRRLASPIQQQRTHTNYNNFSFSAAFFSLYTFSNVT